MKLKKYMVTSDDSEVTAISLVESPAIEENYIALANEKKQILLEKDEKHLVLGAVLIPNRPIYRNDSFGEYYIEFDEKVIEKLSYDFMKRALNQSVTLDHSTDAKNISVVESWIKTSEEDKSNKWFNLPIGTWFAAMKVDDDKVWERVKNEELNGFSIESFVSLEELKLSKQNKESDMEVNESFWDKLAQVIKDILGKNEVENAEEVAEEVVDEAKAEEEVEEEETKEEEMAAEEPTDEPTEEATEVPTEEIVEEVAAIVEESVETEEEQANELQAIVDELQKKVDELTNANEEMKAELEKVQKENQKLSKQPSTNKIEVNASKQNGISAEGKAFLDALYNGNVRY